METATLECPGKTSAVIVSAETLSLFGNIPGDVTGALFLALKKFINASFDLVVVAPVALMSLFNVVVLAVEDGAGRERFKGLLWCEVVAGGFASVPKSPSKASAISDGVSDNDERLRCPWFSYNFRRRFRSALLRFWDEEVVFRMDSASAKSPCGSSWLFDICPKMPPDNLNSKILKTRKAIPTPRRSVDLKVSQKTGNQTLQNPRTLFVRVYTAHALLSGG